MNAELAAGIVIGLLAGAGINFVVGFVMAWKKRR